LRDFQKIRRFCTPFQFALIIETSLALLKGLYTTLFTITGREKQKHKKNQTNNKSNDKKINLTNNLNYIHLSSSSYYTDFHRQKSEKKQTSDLSNIG